MASYTIHLLGSPLAQAVVKDGAFGLNSVGATVGVAHIPEACAALWNPGPTKLPPVGQQSIAYAINDSGAVVGASGQYVQGTWGEILFPSQAFLYTSTDGVMRDLAGVFGGKISAATDINNAGLLAAWAGDIGSLRAFRYDPQAGTGPTDLGVLLGHDESRTIAINNKGQVTGISRSAGEGNHGVIFDGALIDLGRFVYPNDINDHGDVVGEFRVDGTLYYTAFLCEPSSGTLQLQNLGPLPLAGFVGSVAMAINTQRDIVGYSFTPFGPSQAFRAFFRPASGEKAGQMLDLNSLIPWNSGWLLHRASAINDSGQIAGIGTYNGQYRAYLLTPELEVPSEATIDPWALLLTGELYVKLKTLPNPPPDLFITRIGEWVQAMGPAEKGHALARVKALSAYVRALEEELNRRR